MNSIRYVRFSPQSANHELVQQVVAAYRGVFATEPWKEWLKCQKCDEYWGKEDETYLKTIGFEHHGMPLVDFWPKETVLADLQHEITPTSSCWLAMDGDIAVGFTWGYPIDLITLENKLGIPIQSEYNKLFGSVQKIAYQDEVGVLEAYRGKKVAKALVAHRHEDFMNQGLQIGVVRTRQSPKPSLTYLWYIGKLGYRALATYPDGRVVLGRELAGLQELLHL
jgi:GNAT superfamily N-acetyltransferase